MKPSLSVVVLTRNEEQHIGECLGSARDWAGELLVMDAESVDHTVEIARRAGAQVECRAWDNFPSQRNAAIELARGEWVFFLDADERATPAVGRELEATLADCSAGIAGYWIPRRNIIFGKEIRHAGWSPDYQPRLLRRGRARFDPLRTVHELVLWDGEVGYMHEPLIHYNYRNLRQFRTKQVAYTRYEADVWYHEGKRARWRGFVGQPLREFFRRYVGLEGWRDGAHGLLLSGLMAYYAWVRQKMLWEMGRPRRE